MKYWPEGGVYGPWSSNSFQPAEPETNKFVEALQTMRQGMDKATTGLGGMVGAIGLANTAMQAIGSVGSHLGMGGALVAFGQRGAAALPDSLRNAVADIGAGANAQERLENLASQLGVAGVGGLGAETILRDAFPIMQRQEQRAAKYRVAAGSIAQASPVVNPTHLEALDAADIALDMIPGMGVQEGRLESAALEVERQNMLNRHWNFWDSVKVMKNQLKAGLPSAK